MEKACARSIPYKIGPRRVGDVASLYANPEQAKVHAFMTHDEFVISIESCEQVSQLLLGWEAKRELQDMVDDLWRWQKQNPDGYSVSS
jgi:UDP-glucose 4-epimerase